MSDPDRDGARDAWLSQALRHAPDADAAPPTAVSAAILAEARAATERPAASSPRGAPARGGTLAGTLRAWWDALARPPVAAAFASVMAATIVGLMWWDRPMDETVPPPPSATAERKAAATPAPSAAARVDTPAPATAPADPQGAATNDRVAPAEATRKREAPAASPSQENAQPAKQRDAPRPRLDEAKKDAARSSLAGQSAAVPAPSRQAENATATGSLSAAAPAATSVPVEPPPPASPAPAPVVAAAPAARPAPVQARAPVTASPPDSGRAAGASPSEASADRAGQPLAKGIAPGRAPASSADARTRRGDDTDLRDSTDAPERDKTTAAPEPFARRDTPDRRREGAVAATSPLAPLRDAIAREPQRWTRQTAAGAVIGLDPAWRDWLAEVDAAAAGRWQATTAQAQASDDERSDGTVLRLFLDGRAAAVLRLDGQSVRLDTLGAAPQHSRATLAPGVASRLAAGGARLSP